MFEQILVTLVCLLGRSKARELAHGVHLAAITGGVNAAREGRLPGISEILLVVPVFGKIGLGIKTADGNSGNRGVARVSVVIDVDAGGGPNRLFGIFLERGR